MATTGRPTKYKSEYAEQAYKLCLLGYTDRQIASFFEVSQDTIYEWKKKHRQFSESVRRGKDIADAEVAESLFKRATGFSKEGIKQLFHYQGEVIEADTTEYYPPETGAAINWLKNRQKELWRENLADMNFDKLTDEQLDQIFERLKKGVL